MKCLIVGVVLSICVFATLAAVPAQVLDLKNWEIQLPYEKDGNLVMVKQPQLATFSIDPYFYVPSSGGSVVCLAYVNGSTTGGSLYPRSELREMNGTDGASWSTAKGTHTLTVKQAYTHLPAKRPEVVGAQIHEATTDDNLVQVRLNSPDIVLWAPAGDTTLQSNYKLGTVFTLEIRTGGGLLNVSYNGELKYSKKYSATQMYFKTGAYVQSNLNYDEASQYGSVELYSVSVVHTE